MADAQAARSKLWTLDFIKVGMARFFSATTLQVLQTIFPIFLDSRGFSATAIGTVATLFTTCSMIMRFGAGRMVDSGSRRKVGMLGAAFVGVGLIACLLVVLFEPHFMSSVTLPGGSVLTVGMIVIILGRMMHGLGNSTVNITYTTMFADVLPRDRFVEGIGYSGLFNSVAQAIGPAIGIALIALSPTITFSACLAPIVMCFFIVSSLRYESDPDYIKRAKTEDEAIGEEEYKGIWKYFEKRSLPAAVIMFIMAVCSASVSNFLALYTASIGLAGVSVYFTFKAAFMILTRVTSSRFSERLGIYKTIMLGIIITAVGYSIIPAAKSPAMLYFCAAFDGLGCGLAYPMLSVLTLNGVSRKRRGTANSTYLIMWDVGVGVGAMIWGALIDATGGYTPIFTLSGALLVIDFIISVWLSKKYPARM